MSKLFLWLDKTKMFSPWIKRIIGKTEMCLEIMPGAAAVAKIFFLTWKNLLAIAQ